KIGVMINKIDRPDQRYEEVQSMIEDLLLELVDLAGMDDYDIDIPFFFGSGRDGYASDDPEARDGSLTPLLDFFTSSYFPDPNFDKEAGFQLLVTNLTYSQYLGSLMVGRIVRGEVFSNRSCMWIGKDGKPKQIKLTKVQIFDGLGYTEVESAQ